MNTRTLLLVTAFVEAGTGLALLVVPSMTVELLLGAALVTSQAMVLGRVTGSALLSIGVACWLARSDDVTRTGLVAGLLLYNGIVPLLLVHAALESEMRGLALWPASVLHVLLAGWCVICLGARKRAESK